MQSLFPSTVCGDFAVTFSCVSGYSGADLSVQHFSYSVDVPFHVFINDIVEYAVSLDEYLVYDTISVVSVEHGF